MLKSRTLKNKSHTSSFLTCTDFVEYFKDLGNPTDVSYIADDHIYERIRIYDEGLLNDSFQELNDVRGHKSYQRIKNR